MDLEHPRGVDFSQPPVDAPIPSFRAHMFHEGDLGLYIIQLRPDPFVLSLKEFTAVLTPVPWFV